MKRFLPVFSVGCALSFALLCGCQSHAAPIPAPVAASVVAPQNAVTRPQYKMNLEVDYAKRTFTNDAEITIPVAAGDTVRDVSFFIYANADGVGTANIETSSVETPSAETLNAESTEPKLTDATATNAKANESKATNAKATSAETPISQAPSAQTPSAASKKTPNIVVESVLLNGAPLKFSVVGAVLKVTLPQAQTSSFTLKIKTNGRVPVAPAGSEGLGGMLSGVDLGSILGGTSSTRSKPKNQDYGLYTFGGNVLSLGSFWYPTLAIRRDGQWLDAAPEGLGDVSYAEMSDYRVWITVPKTPAVQVAMQIRPQMNGLHYDSIDEKTQMNFYGSRPARDFSILMSDDYETKSKVFDVAGKQVRVQTFTTKTNAAKADAAIEIAGRALQIYAKRFGAYNYGTFTVAEAPIRGGAGGMEYSGMTGIASMLYGDLGAQLGGLFQMFGAGSSTGSSPLGDVMAKQKAVLDSLFEETIAHEVAHQWWAIGVGSDSANAPWLDESLTNYSSMIYWEDRYGKARAQQMSDAHLKSSYAFARMLGTTDARADLKSAAHSDGLQYGAVVYGKGALFYGVLRKLLGDEKFFAAIREYYAKFNGKLADKNALRSIFKARNPAKATQIDALYKRWIEGKNGDADITNGKVMTMGDLLGGMAQ